MNIFACFSTKAPRNPLRRENIYADEAKNFFTENIADITPAIIYFNFEGSNERRFFTLEYERESGKILLKRAGLLIDSGVYDPASAFVGIAIDENLNASLWWTQRLGSEDDPCKMRCKRKKRETADDPREKKRSRT